jgi:hypothetical protein
MAEYRASLRINVGPNASFDALAAIVKDTGVVVDFAQDVQAVVDRNDATYRVLRQRNFGPVIDDFDLAPGYVRNDFLAALLSSGSPFLRSSAFEQAVEQQLTEIGRNRIVTTRNITYSNPLDIHFNFDGSGIARVLEIIRDWGPDRRAANVRARIDEARASSYEEDLQFKRDIHNTVRDALASRDLRIGHDETTALLTTEVQRSLESILRADPEAEVELDTDGAV